MSRPLKAQQQGKLKKVTAGQFEVLVTRTETYDLTGLLHRHRTMKAELESVRRELKRHQEREEQLVSDLAESEALLQAEGLDPNM